MKFSVSMTAQKKRLFFYSKRPKMGQFRRVKQNQQISNGIKFKFETIKFDNFPKNIQSATIFLEGRETL